ncbi:hypothetical protein HYH37_00405 [Clostridium botulinum]|uniref:DUF7210 family protein n=1 Tax=Clostridium botulinum TaxID=1491 RepID=UPI001C9AE036|nr:hypothetical protein [Clostridium botulinum]MBY6871673.1 hypothetical protein [Clostridium botulinum]
MSKKKEENLVKAKAKVYLKYDKDFFKIGEELKVRIEDAKEMVEKEYVELLENLPKEDTETPGEDIEEGE